MKRVLVVAPHQDDETLGCGGLIARKRYEGLPVHVVFITDGSATFKVSLCDSEGITAHGRKQRA